MTRIHAYTRFIVAEKYFIQTREWKINKIDIIYDCLRLVVPPCPTTKANKTTCLCKSTLMTLYRLKFSLFKCLYL